MSVSYTNDIGQVINPGDEVVIVTTGYGHSVSTNKAVYIGLHSNGGAQCMKKVKSYFYVFKDTEERVPQSWVDDMNRAINEWVINFRQNNTGAWYNNPEYKAFRNSWADQIEVKTEYVDQRTTLKLNRIYKLAA